jgi:hypothetical protein
LKEENLPNNNNKNPRNSGSAHVAKKANYLFILVSGRLRPTMQPTLIFLGLA